MNVEKKVLAHLYFNSNLLECFFGILKQKYILLLNQYC